MVNTSPSPSTMIMAFEQPCDCSIEALQIMTELQGFHTVVDVDTVLDLIHRLCQQGSIIVQCAACEKSPSSSIVTLPALSEQCLPLLEALCSAYNISAQPGFFDSAMHPFEQPPSSFICVRSKVVLGQTELDDGEGKLLVRALLGRNLIRLVELMEGLKKKLLMMLDKQQTHRNGIAALRACEASVESTISRLAVLMQGIEGDSGNAPLG